MPVEDTSPSKENLKDAIFQAAELFKSADFAEAQKRCQTILLSHPENLEAHYMLLRMEWQQGHVSTAVAKLKRFLNKAPDWQQGEQALKFFEEKSRSL